jgi:light-regulated signal transduction histidine kinase (bacteriophytochrome)
MAQTTSRQHPAIVGARIILGAAPNITVGPLAVLVILLGILLVAAALFAAVADRRRRQAEAANLDLTSELMQWKQAEEQNNKSKAELERQLADRTRQLADITRESELFSYSVAHDLRAPLRHISGFAKILSDDYSASLDATAQEYLRFVCAGAKHMGQLIDALLKMARIGRLQLVPTPTDLNRLVSGAIESLRPEYEGRQIEWRIQPLPSIECDPMLMKQLFESLLSNAVKYTRPREKAVIEVGRLATEGAPTIFIRDNGAGFDQRYAHKLFGVFQRLHTSEEFEGTGVGLATVHRILVRHGGRIWGEADLDKGATFFFTLAGDREGAANATKSSAPGEE